MIKEEFILAVNKAITVKDESDLNIVNLVIKRCYIRGFTVNDAVRYCKCLEEVNPALDETVALKRMDQISAKYPP